MKHKHLFLQKIPKSDLLARGHRLSLSIQNQLLDDSQPIGVGGTDIP